MYYNNVLRSGSFARYLLKTPGGSVSLTAAVEYNVTILYDLPSRLKARELCRVHEPTMKSYGTHSCVCLRSSNYSAHIHRTYIGITLWLAYNKRLVAVGQRSFKTHRVPKIVSIYDRPRKCREHTSRAALTYTCIIILFYVRVSLGNQSRLSRCTSHRGAPIQPL